jgi:hypothetical protein
MLSLTPPGHVHPFHIVKCEAYFCAGGWRMDSSLCVRWHMCVCSQEAPKAALANAAARRWGRGRGRRRRGRRGGRGRG